MSFEALCVWSSEPVVRKWWTAQERREVSFISWTEMRWLSGWSIRLQCRRHQRHESDPWVRKIPWRRKWQPTPRFFPGESHGQRSLKNYSLQGCREWDMKEATEHARGPAGAVPWLLLAENSAAVRQVTDNSGRTVGQIWSGRDLPRSSFFSVTHKVLSPEPFPI